MNWLRLILLGIFMHGSMQATSFQTLAEVQAYAKANPEYVKPDNNDWLNPNFDIFHKKNKPNLFQRIFIRLGMPTSVWDWRGFSKAVHTSIELRKKTPPKGDFSERFSPNVNDKFIIWGDLYGAFHSLVRDLTFLQQQGIIDTNLKIKLPYYFVFNGNVIEGSPYVLETLNLIICLMNANPDQVFYTRGYYETEERWQNFEMMRELRQRFGKYTGRYNAALDLFGKFFQTLPVALYLTQEKEKEVDVIIMSSNDRISRYFNTAGLFDVKDTRGYFLHGDEKIKAPKKINVPAFITGEDRTITYHVTQGLTLIGAVEGAIRWMVFSSPTERNQHLFKFNYDAFAQLDVTDGMDQWTIELYHEKVPELKGFKKAAKYNLVTGHTIRGKKSESQATDLFFGSSMDLSKSASPIGRRVEEGLQLAFTKAGAENIVPGIIPKLTTVDDQYTPIKTRAAVQDFIKKGITMLIGSQGSPSLESYLDLIEDEKVLVMFPLTGAPEFRKPSLSHLIHYRGSYIKEGEDLIKYALKNLQARRVAIFYQDDAFGRGALEGAQRALKEAGISTFLGVPHERNAVNFVKQAKSIMDFNPDTILFSSNTVPIRGLIRQMGVQYFAGKNLLGISVYEDAFERFLKDKGLSFIIVRMVPDPATSNLPIAKEYRKWADAQNISYDKIAFEEFIGASILFEVLRQIKGPITKEKVIAFFESMKNYPFKGLTLNFNPETRELSDTLWLDTGTVPWIKKTGRDLGPEKTISEQEKRLRFGSLLDLSKGVRAEGKAVKIGMEVRLHEAIAHKMEKVPTIDIVDDNYDPTITKQEVKKFIKKGITIFVCTIGSPTLESYLDLVRQKKVAVLFPITGAPIFRAEDLTNIVNLRASYANEATVMAQYALDQMHAKKIMLFYQNDAFGKSLLDAAHKVLEDRNFSDKLDIAYERNTVDYIQQVAKAKEYNPDTILFCATATAARNFIRQFGIREVSHLNILGNSDMGESSFTDFAKDTGLKFVYLNVVPNPQESQLPIVQQYREACKQQNVVLDTFSLESYISVDILLYALSLIPGNVTKKAIIKALSSLTNKEYKGLMLNFNPKTHTLLHSLWLNKGTPDWQMINVDQR